MIRNRNICDNIWYVDSITIWEWRLARLRNMRELDVCFFCLKEMQSACTPFKTTAWIAGIVMHVFEFAISCGRRRAVKFESPVTRQASVQANMLVCGPDSELWQIQLKQVSRFDVIWFDWCVSQAVFLIGSFSWSCRTCISKVSWKKIALQKLEFGSQKVISQNKSRLFLACEFVQYPKRRHDATQQTPRLTTKIKQDMSSAQNHKQLWGSLYFIQH